MYLIPLAHSEFAMGMMLRELRLHWYMYVLVCDRRTKWTLDSIISPHRIKYCCVHICITCINEGTRFLYSITSVHILSEWNTTWHIKPLYWPIRPANVLCFFLSSQPYTFVVSFLAIRRLPNGMDGWMNECAIQTMIFSWLCLCWQIFPTYSL